jgi:hypothetical protein
VLDTRYFVIIQFIVSILFLLALCSTVQLLCYTVSCVINTYPKIILFN